jgi:SAM-dependent methyltransferase
MDADAFNAFEVAGWERQVAGYEDFFVPITARLAVPLLDATAVAQGTRVLDVATGPGHLAAAAAERGASVVGADVAEGMLALARREHPQLEFVHGDAEDLPFADGSFDAVIAGFVLLHLGRPEQAAAEFARVLRPGGRVALAMWDTPDRSRLPGVLVEAIADAGAAPPSDLPPGPPIFRFSDEGELRGLLGALDDVQVQTVSFLHRVASPDALWDGLLGGTVRLSVLVWEQPEDVRQRIRAAFDERVRDYLAGEVVEIPVSVKLASGVKAGGPASAAT